MNKRDTITGRSLIKPLLSILFMLFQIANAQEESQIFGIISSKETGEPIVGINVSVVGTTIGASTDLDGKYFIKKIQPGKYTLRISGIGYSTKVITDLVITGRSEELNLSINEETYNLNEVVITADEVRSTESALLSQRKRSNTISDGISAEQIKRTPDATSGDALKRITGISVVENKFVYIRGITDRYNETTLDGAPVASTSVGKKSFSFDMLPSNLLDNTNVLKSSTPDLPGDFSGGLVQLNTLDFPSNQVIKLNFGTAYNTSTTARDILRSQGGKTDFLGFDDGIRKFPDKEQAIDNAKSAPNTWAPRMRKAPLNTSFSLSVGNRIDFEKDDNSSNQIGYITALTYKNSFQNNQRIIDDWQVGRYNSGNKFENSILWGFLGNISYKYSGLHKISFKNNFDQSAEDVVTRFNSQDFGNYQDKIYTTINWTQRSIYTGQLSGEHDFPRLGGLSLQWRGSLSSSARKDPDRKEVAYYRNIDEPTQPYTAAINQRSWARMNDRALSFNIDITYPLSSFKVKIGLKEQRSVSNFSVSYFSVVPDYYGGMPESLASLPLETIYSTQNYGPGKFLFQESSKASDSYDGGNKLHAGYAMLDIPFEIFKNKFRLIGGARIENSDQNVEVPKTRIPGGPVNKTNLKKTDVLPSLNFTYNLNDFTNIRFAYSHSVNRPDTRELASTGFYDFMRYEIVGGNPNLQRALIRNIDLRIETFPLVGEVFALSVFQKNITDAIEEQLIQSSTRTRTWFNSPKASNFGWEVEVRKTLGFIGDYFSNFSITGNYTQIQSRVEFEEIEGNSASSIRVVKTRPLQGQSPYMINASLFFMEPYLGISINLMYNKFGRRLETVGFLTGDIYEEAKDIIDLSITQSISKDVESKFTVKNLTDKDRVLTQDSRLYEKFSYGRTYSLQLSYGF